MIHHHFSVDVEEHFQVLALEPFVPRERWGTLESRVERNVSRLLDLLEQHGSLGTFFVLGWVAERHPQLVRRISGAGHEIASHGQDHRRVPDQTPQQFRESVSRSRRLLEDLVGSAVLGFRAPSFSILTGTEWALDVLIEEGYRYDSSLFPVRRPGYGYAGGARDAYWLQRRSGRLWEVPPVTLRVAGANIPAAGGGYFRLLPYGLVSAALRQAESRGVPGTFYIHPWEVDPEQPRFEVPWATRLRHYGGLSRTTGRLDRLLNEFRFTTIASRLAAAEREIASHTAPLSV